MSLILKGINLPSKNARDYIVIAWYETNTHGGLDLKSKFVEYADIVQIPKDHGNIIDSKDILIPVHCIPKTIGLTDRAQEKIEEMIENAPTILEAEEENDANNNAESHRNNSSLLQEAPMQSM